MSAPDDAPQKVPLTPAESIYCQYLQLESSVDYEGFETLCAQNAELEPDLRQLHYTWKRVASIRMHLDQPPSFAARLRHRYGAAIDPAISLDGEGQSAGESGSGPLDSGVISLRAKLALKGGESTGRRYKMRDEVARGGMGAIYKVWDKDLRRTMAMKVVLPTGKQDGRPIVSERVLARFLEEAQITGQLDHPGIVPVHELGLDSEGNVYFTMRFVRGRDLKTIIDLALEDKEDWSVVRVLGVIQRVCEAVAFAHSKGVVHRDLKPANIMVGRFGETYVMDWGLARVLGREEQESKPDLPDSTVSLVQTDRHDASESDGSNQATMLGDVVGTPSYMSPEQARGQLDRLGPRSDVYSVGSILYHLFSGQAPFVPPGARVAPHQVLAQLMDGPPKKLLEIHPKLASELVAICEKSMAREPEDRYQTMMALADDLRAYLEGEVVSAYESGAWAEFRKWTQRNRALSLALGGALLLAIASLISIVVIQSRSTSAMTVANSQLEQQADELQATAEVAKAQEALAKENAAQLASANTDLAESFAEVQRKEELARLAGEAAAAAAEESRRRSYVAAILAADYSLRLNEQGKAKRLLESCDEDLRGWEWNNLWLRSDTSLNTLRPWDSLSMIGAVFSETSDEIICFSNVSALVLDREARAQREVTFADLETAIFERSFGGRSSRNSTPNAVGNRMARFVVMNGVTALTAIDTQELTLASVITEVVSTPVELYLSPTGDRLATYAPSEDSLAFYDADVGKLEAELRADNISALAIGPRLERYAVAFDRVADNEPKDRTIEGNTIEIRRYPTDEVLERLVGHTGLVQSLSFSANSKRLLSTSRDSTARVWSVPRGELISTAFGHTGPVTTGLFVEEGSEFLTGSSDRTVRLWSTTPGALLRTMNGHTASIIQLSASFDGSEILSVDADGLAKLWDPHIPAAYTSFNPSFGLSALLRLPVAGSEPRRACFTAGGARLLSATQGGLIWSWDQRTGSPIRTFGPADTELLTMEPSPADDTLALLTVGGSVQLWDSGDGRKLGDLEDLTAVRDIAIRPDGLQLAAMQGKRISLWNLADRTLERKLPPHGRRTLVELLYSPDGSTLIAGTPRDIYTWDLTRPDEPPRAFASIDDKLAALAVRPDGGELAVGTRAGTIHLWNLETGLHRLALALSGDPVASLAYHPDGTRLAVGRAGHTIDLWDTTLGETLLVLDAAERSNERTFMLDAVISVEFSPDGQRLLAAGTRGRTSGDLRTWESSSTAERRFIINQASALGARMEPRVSKLYASLYFEDAVRRALARDKTLTRAERDAGLRIVAVRGDDLALARDAWSAPLYADPPAGSAALLDALEIAQHAARSASDSLQARFGVGQLLYGLERYEESAEALRAAEELLRERISLSDLRGELLVMLALVHDRIGEQAQSAEYLDTIRTTNQFNTIQFTRRPPFIDELFTLDPEVAGQMIIPDVPAPVDGPDAAPAAD